MNTSFRQLALNLPRTMGMTGAMFFFALIPVVERFAAADTTNLVISSISVTQSNLILSGSGGVSGAVYYVLASTNLGLSPVSLWDRISTNTFAADGTFANSVPINPTVAQEFFAITTAFQVPDTNAPTAPGNLTATAVSSNQIDLSWMSSTDNVAVTGYLLERYDPINTNFVQIGTTMNTNYNDMGLAANTEYSYRVRATDAAANLGPYSSVATATTFAIVPVASFNGSPTNGLAPLTVTFTDVSTGTISNRFWDFGDSNTTNTTATSVLHTYTGAGINTVSLTVTGPAGANSVTQTDYVVVVNPAQLVVSPVRLDYGSVTIGQTNSLSFSVINTGDLLLSGTATSAAPFAVTSGGTYDVPGGQTQAVSVAFAPGAAGIFTGSVVFVSDGGISTNEVKGVGLTAGSISVSPLAYDFGSLATGTTAQTTFVVTNTGGTAVSNGTVTVDPPFTIVSGAMFSVPGLGTTNVVLQFAPVGIGGVTSGVFFATANGGDWTNMVSGTGTIALVAAYSFDEGTGTTAVDLSGNGNNGTISGATWTNAGQYGNALVFNGSNSVVNVVDSPSLHLTTAVTLEAWVFPTAAISFWKDIVYKGRDNFYLEAGSSQSGSPAVGGTFDTSNDVAAIGTEPVASNAWTHLAGTYDGATVRLYVNGSEVSSLAQTGSISTSTNSLQIGGDDFFPLQFFNGMIDEVRVYNVALTAAQIQSDMVTPVSSLTNAPAPPEPFAAWQLLYFGCTNLAICPQAAGDADADGDGMSNTNEFLAGTDPTNNASAFRVTSIAQDGTNVLVTWMMGPDKTNALQTTAGDVSGNYDTNNFTDIFTVTNTIGPTTNYLDVGAATNFPSRYYRVRLVP